MIALLAAHPESLYEVRLGRSPVAGREGVQTNNPGFPGFGSSGWVYGGGVHVAVEY